jgi:2-C-methyl-D-erythritol 2,4-cyclodiphosphate synthase
MAEVMGVSVEDVSVKATTTEKLGFVGRGEGCEVYAVALLKK